MWDLGICSIISIFRFYQNTLAGILNNDQEMSLEEENVWIG